MATRAELDDQPLTGIVAAMAEELAPLRARLADARALAVPGGRVSVTVGRLGGVHVALAVTGDGARNAREGLAALLEAVRVRRLVVIGVAGGLSAELATGALVVGARVVDEADGSVREADDALVALVATRAARGVAVTARRIADTANEKRRLLALARAAADAGERPAIVDLESAAFAAVAERAGVPWVVLRAVSDPADESVPALLNRSRDDGGAVRRGRVAFGLIADPRALPRLLVLARRVRACAEALARALERALDADALGSTSLPLRTEPEPTRASEEA